MDQYPRIVPTGDCALQVEFENEISIPVNSKVVRLRRYLETKGLPGVTETLQVYRSLMVHYRPEIIRYEELKKKLEAVLRESDILQADAAKRGGLSAAGGMGIAETVRGTGIGLEADPAGTDGMPGTDRTVTDIPVLYGGEWGPDLEEVAGKEGITAEEVVRRHSANLNYLYFIGFSPGLCYVGNPGQTFTVGRRDTPRVKLPRGSVTICGNQTTVFPVVQPGGWNVIGRTPLVLFDPEKDPAFLLHSGQWIRFVPVSEEEYHRIEQEIEAGTYQVRTYMTEAQDGDQS